MKVLITGGTGFIGSSLLSSFIESAQTIYLLVRNKQLEKTQQLYADQDKIKIIVGDIKNSNVIFSAVEREDIIENIDTVIHMAASYDLTADYETNYFTNIIGTQNICQLCFQMKQLKYFHYISTIAVSGNFEGIFPETPLTTNDELPNFYAETKYIAETIVQKSKFKNAKTRIYRPGIVVGNCHDGEIQKIDGPYYLMQFLYKLKKLAPLSNLVPFLPLPYRKDIKLPIIPVDLLVLWLKEMITSPKGDEQIKCYHLIPEKTPNIEAIVKNSSKYYGIKNKFIAVKPSKLMGYIFDRIKIPKETISYMTINCQWSIKNRKEDYPQLPEINFAKHQEIFFQGCERFFKQREQKK